MKDSQAGYQPSIIIGYQANVICNPCVSVIYHLTFDFSTDLASSAFAL
jgi:hypothetical protein